MHYSTSESPPSTVYSLRPCPYCGAPAPHHLAPGTAVHYARWLCTHCGRFLRWHKWPRDSEGNKLARPASLIDALRKGVV